MGMFAKSSAGSSSWNRLWTRCRGVPFERVAKRWGCVAVLLARALTPALLMAQFDGPALVEVAPVQQQAVAAGQEFVGTVFPTKTAVIGSAVDGRVIEFPVNEGDRVEAGQTLAQLLTETIALELRAAEAELQLRQEEWNELKNGSRLEEIEQARARMEAARAAQVYLTARRTRTEKLFGDSEGNPRLNPRVTSEESLQEAVSASVRADELLKEAEAAYALVKAGPRQEKKTEAEAQVAMQAAQVDKLKDQIKKHTIVSRFAGYVTEEHTEVGQWLKQGEPVVQVIALDEVDVEAYVLENHIRFVHVGTPARVEIPALAAPALTGQVVLVVPQADERSRTFRVKIRLQNTIQDGQPLLKAGMLARHVAHRRHAAGSVGAQRCASSGRRSACAVGGQRQTSATDRRSRPWWQAVSGAGGSRAGSTRRGRRRSGADHRRCRCGRLRDPAGRFRGRPGE